MYFLTLFLVPAFFGLIAKLVFQRKVSWKEYAVLETVALFILLAAYGIAKSASLADVEIWNGQITAREKRTVSCSHSYDCNCIPLPKIDIDGDVYIDIDCDTCYRHVGDYDWQLYTNIGETITVSRIDSQGAEMPPRWGSAYVGEPIAVRRNYFNYVRRQPSLVLRGVESFDPEKYQVPGYPDKVYDLYRVDRFLSSGYSEPNAAVWNDLLQKLNGRLGPAKEANVIVIAAKADPVFEYALEEAWLAGKKNDVIVILGVPESPKISWVGIVSWSLTDDFRDSMIQRIKGIGSLDRRDDILLAVEKTVSEKFRRRTMEEIKLQIASFEPGKGATRFLWVLGFLVQVFLLAIMAGTDPFGDER